MNEHIIGDVSKWQPKMDWPTAAAAGMDGVMIRSGSIDNASGTCYEDYEWQANIRQTAIPVWGAYWYWRPNWSPIKQAEYFARQIQDLPWLLPPAADVEELAGMGKAQIASALWVFLNRIENNAKIKARLLTLPEKLGRPFIYTNPLQIWVNVGPTTWAYAYPLWIAHWGTDEPYIPSDWKLHSWTMHQWGKVDGKKFGSYENQIDMNRWNKAAPWPSEATGTISTPAAEDVVSGSITINGNEYKLVRKDKR